MQVYRDLEKYNDFGDRILSKLNYSDYNKNIRKILKHVGINRKVVVINLMTRESEMKRELVEMID